MARRRACALLALAASVAAISVPATNVTTATRACQGEFANLPFCDASQPLAARVQDLVARLWSAAEGADLVIPPQLTARHETQGQNGPNANVTSLGLPEYDWGMNAIHGVQSSGVLDASNVTYVPTSFPNPNTYGSAWNKSLAWELGAIIATEARALWLAGATEFNGNPPPHIGLDAWSPNINIARDPRWGRNQEVASEDPLLNGDFGSQYTQGLQRGEDPRFIKVAVTLKHWDAYSLENSDGFTRYNFNAVVSNYSLASTYFPAFKKAVVEGGAAGVMCSYNALNGVPTCASSFLNGVLRGSWSFDGYVTSDSGAIENVYQYPSGHGYVNGSVAAACVSARDGGTDVCSGSVYQSSLMNITDEAVCAGGKDAIDTALTHTLGLRMRLGLFDPIEDQPYWHVPLSAVGTPASAAASKFAALSGMLLLKHDGVTLPFTPGKRVAVIGPHAQAKAALLGNYLGQMCPEAPGSHVGNFTCVLDLADGIGGANAGGVTSALVTPPNVTSNDTSLFGQAVALAQAADYVILALGIDGSVENEMRDRTGIDLPPAQHALAAQIAALGKPTAIVLVHGGPVDVSAERDSSGIGAILSAGYPGQYGASAIGDTLFGANGHLGGKAAVTWYPASYVNEIAMSEMELDVGPGRGYRYYSGESVFPFGYGLSLTNFSLSPAAVPSAAAAGATLAAGDASSSASLSYAVQVTNTGERPGDEVVQLYWSAVGAPTGVAMPRLPLLKTLADYQRVHLEPGQSTVVTFNVSAATLKLVDAVSGDGVSAPGTYRVVITNGAGQTPVEQAVTVRGQLTVVEPFPRW